MKILVVDDEQAVRESLRRSLRFNGYEVLTANDGLEAVETVRAENPELLILDVMMPNMDGLEVCRTLRSEGWDRPILVLTARDGVSDRVAGLDAGADDYLPKPFALEELLARVRVALRHGSPQQPSAQREATMVRAGDVLIDVPRHSITKAGKPLHLTPTEWGVLTTLLRAHGGLVRKEDLLAEIWGPGFEGQSHYLRIYTSQLRRKLETDPSNPQYLLTEPGLGYRFITSPGV